MLVPLRWWYAPSQYTVWCSLLVDGGDGSRCHFEFGSMACRGDVRGKSMQYSRFGLDDKPSRAAGQRGMTDVDETLGLSKRRSRFTQVLWSSRRSGTRSGDVRRHWLGLQRSSELSVEWYQVNFRALVKSTRIYHEWEIELGAFKKSTALNQYSFFVVVIVSWSVRPLISVGTSTVMVPIQQ
jgi:hypothetical protein